VRFRSVDGEHHDPERLVAVLRAHDPRFDPRRWFVEYAICQVLRRQWGRNTEPTLTALADAFPQAKVTFRAAQP